MSSELRKLFFVLQKCLSEPASQRCKSAAFPSLRGCPHVTVTCPCPRGFMGQRVMGGALQPVGKSIHIKKPWSIIGTCSCNPGLFSRETELEEWSQRKNKCPVKPRTQQIVNHSSIKGRYETGTLAPVFSFINTPKTPTQFYMQNRKDAWVYRRSTRISPLVIFARSKSRSRFSKPLQKEPGTPHAAQQRTSTAALM